MANTAGAAPEPSGAPGSPSPHRGWRDRYDIAASILIAAGLFLTLHLRLLSTLISGLVVYELVRAIEPRLYSLHGRLRPGDGRGKGMAVTLLATVIAALLAALVLGLVAFFRSDAGSLPELLNKLAGIISDVRDSLPAWLAVYVPDSMNEIKANVVDWLHEHATSFTGMGEVAVRISAHILVGLVVGALVALRRAPAPQDQPPLARALFASITRLGEAFRRVVFAQVRISLLNTVLSAIYLVAVLPLFDVHLPLVKTLILITFVAGLLPIIGNLVSNVLIVVVSLGFSFQAAVASLVFLVVIHKLEYFLNARIVGSRIHAATWELLLAMLVMEAAFGLPGVIAAPFFYAYFKDELASRGLI
ncbi:MAG TPA: AI-2E family transporter [Burkholderiales bacterium]|nr:AI-2E family transporter [Burkholderiales bacterium]